MKLTLLVSFILSCFFAHAQEDTIRLMHYNTTNYGFPATQSCPLLNPTLKHPYMRTIMQYIDADIIGLVKMYGTPETFTTDTVIQKVLDSVCEGCWGHTPFTNVSGYYKENMLYFKTAKIGWISTTTIYSADTNVSDINLHRLYYRSAGLATTHDTVFINIVQCHDKSGNDKSDSTERAANIAGAMNWLNTHVTAPGNYIFMGDFNTQTSTEGAYQSAVSAFNIDARFTDPSGQVGNWSADPSAYAGYLTQSSRINDPGDCGSTGGMTEIFDHILCTTPVMQGSHDVKYIPGSYAVVGQDGQHTNKAITDAPTNTSAPYSVINALYNMSSHLPVTVLLSVSSSPQTGIRQTTGRDALRVYPNPARDVVTLDLAALSGEGLGIRVIDMLGRQVYSESISSVASNKTISTNTWPDGLYTIIAESHEATYTQRVVVAR